MKILVSLALVCSCLAQTRASVSKAAAAAKWPVHSISIEGLHNYTREQVLEIAGIKVGQVAGRADFDAARDRLVACGAFETVSYKFAAAAQGGGYSATFQVTEVQQVYPVEFEDLHVSSKDLKETLQAKDPLFAGGKLPATHPVIDRYTKWIHDYMVSHGVDEPILGTVAPSMPGEFAIVFRPSRSLPAVAMINFEGNTVVPSNVLREAVAGAGIGSPYTEDTFRQILNSAIRPVYEARGRLRASFPQIRTEPAKDVQGVNVFVTVDEGESYSLGKVTIEGANPLPAETLMKAGDFKTGDVANMARVAEGVERMRLALRRAGYMDAKALPHRFIDDGKGVVNVSVDIEPGPQFTMGKLTIVGLDLEGEAEIKRIWGMKEGKPYNPDYPDSFLKRVRDEGLFDGLGETRSDVKLNNTQHTADVTLRFGAAGEKGPGRRKRGV